MGLNLKALLMFLSFCMILSVAASFGEAHHESEEVKAMTACAQNHCDYVRNRWNRPECRCSSAARSNGENNQ